MTSRWALRLRSRLDRFFRHPWVDGTIMVLILVSVVLVVVELQFARGGVEGGTLRAVMAASDALTAFFIVELSLRWLAAPSTKAHWREYWLDWLAVVPVFRPLRALRALRVLRLLRLYRFGVLAHRFAGTVDPRDFEDALQRSLAHYHGPHADTVRLAPELYRCLVNLLDDGRVHGGARGLVCRAVAYFVLPFDVLPEEVHGGEGFVDDVYFALWTLDRLREELPDHVLEDAWEGEGLLAGLLEGKLSEVADMLSEDERGRIGRYVGVGGKRGGKEGPASIVN